MLTISRLFFVKIKCSCYAQLGVSAWGLRQVDHDDDGRAQWKNNWWTKSLIDF